MNKKGFTLVELLAVIVILTLLALITTTSVTKIVSDSKNDLSNTQIELIKSAAKIWGTENIKRLPGPGECAYITLGELKKYGIMDSSINNPLNNQEISDALTIKISNALIEYGKEIISYEVNPESIEGCQNIGKLCVAVTAETKTTGNVPGGKYNPGDEYICYVGPEKSYRFFVLKKDGSNIYLIMESNITRDGYAIKNSKYIDFNNPSDWNTAWITESDYKTACGNNPGICSNTSYEDDELNKVIEIGSEFGPITAQKYLMQATSDWQYINKNNIQFANYGQIDDIFKYHSACDSGDSPSMINFRLECLPLWLTNYLFNDKYIIEEKLAKVTGYSEKAAAYDERRTHINNLGAYWLNNFAGNYMAHEIGIDAGEYGKSKMYVDSTLYPDLENTIYIGVRPVINLKLEQLP